MKVATFTKLFIQAFITTLILFTRPALGQVGQQCTLDEISGALNQLECEAPGVFVSPAALVEAVADICDLTLTAEQCHSCFTKRGAKIAPALKGLVRIKLLPRTTLRDFRSAIYLAEEETCAPKEQEDEDEFDEDEDSERFSK